MTFSDGATETGDLLIGADGVNSQVLEAVYTVLADMDAAETTQAFIAADTEFHGIIVAASGNSTLASLIQNLSGGTLRARIWRSVIEQDAIEVTKRRHWDIYSALRDGDAERARAAGPDPSFRGRALARTAHALGKMDQVRGTGALCVSRRAARGGSGGVAW